MVLLAQFYTRLKLGVSSWEEETSLHKLKIVLSMYNDVLYMYT